MSGLHWIVGGSTEFPDTRRALREPNGLLAVGGNLSAGQLLAAYRRGIFPWYDVGQPVLWWSPDPRLVLFPGDLHVSRSMRKLLRQGRFTVTTDVDFEGVIDACAMPRPGQDGTWISPEIRSAYCQLHRLGYAHSVEVREANRMVGGLYGIALGRVFFGESMFSHSSNASKYGFVCLVKGLQKCGYKMLDCQVHTTHLASLGAVEIPRRKFEQFLIDYDVSLNRPSDWPAAQICEQSGEDSGNTSDP